MSSALLLLLLRYYYNIATGSFSVSWFEMWRRYRIDLLAKVGLFIIIQLVDVAVVAYRNKRVVEGALLLAAGAEESQRCPRRTLGSILFLSERERASER